MADHSNAVLLYGRWSSSDLTDLPVTRRQRTALADHAWVRGLSVVGEFWDEREPGTSALAARTGGRTLLTAARSHPGVTVLCYRLDVLGRSLRVTLDALERLRRARVSVRFLYESAAAVAAVLEPEQPDESSDVPSGQRQSAARDHQARLGKWTGGTLPLGYEVDAERYLVPSTRVNAEAGMSEVELVRDLFQRVADGSTSMAEARRLNGLRVEPIRRYGTGREVRLASAWRPGRVHFILRNPLYKGVHVLKSRNGPIERQVPALVDADLWERANAQLTGNRTAVERDSRRGYLLRGLINCGLCGSAYVGSGSRSVYRCSGQLAANRPAPETRCRAKSLSLEWLDSLAWNLGCAYLLDLESQLEQATVQPEAGEESPVTRATRERLRALEDERNRLIGLYRESRITRDEVEQHLAAAASESEDQRRLLARLEGSADRIRRGARGETDPARLYALREHVARLGDNAATDDRRKLIESLDLHARVLTLDEGEGPKSARVTFTVGPTRTEALFAYPTRVTGSRTLRKRRHQVERADGR